MNTQDIIEKIGLISLSKFEHREVNGVIISDMMSDVMAVAKSGNLWITIQTHRSIIPAAHLVDVSAVIIGHGKEVPGEHVQGQHADGAGEQGAAASEEHEQPEKEHANAGQKAQQQGKGHGSSWKLGDHITLAIASAGPASLPGPGPVFAFLRSQAEAGGEP